MLQPRSGEEKDDEQCRASVVGPREVALLIMVNHSRSGTMAAKRLLQYPAICGEDLAGLNYPVVAAVKAIEDSV